jgi:hypothetical protein
MFVACCRNAITVVSRLWKCHGFCRNDASFFQSFSFRLLMLPTFLLTCVAAMDQSREGFRVRCRHQPGFRTNSEPWLLSCSSMHFVSLFVHECIIGQSVHFIRSFEIAVIYDWNASCIHHWRHATRRCFVSSWEHFLLIWELLDNSVPRAMHC